MLARDRAFGPWAGPMPLVLILKLMSSPVSRSLYFENSAGRIWEEASGYLRLDYKAGPRDIVQFRAILTHLMQAMSRHRWSRAMIDQRLMSPYTSTEQTWMSEEWLPRAVHEYGYRYGAALVAHDVFARLAMNQFVLSNRSLPHTYRSFETEETAVAWLESMSGQH